MPLRAQRRNYEHPTGNAPHEVKLRNIIADEKKDYMDRTRPPIILIIDDDPSLRDSLHRTLRTKGYAVMEAAEGSQGIKIVQSHSIDVVLVDLFMPGKEGLETIMELRPMQLLQPESSRCLAEGQEAT